MPPFEPVKTIIGIVTHEFNDESCNTTKYNVWCRESFPGCDGILTPRPGQTLEVGQYVLVRFTVSEMQLYFPSPKSPNTPRFMSSDYRTISNIHPTKVESRTVYASFDQFLPDNQSIIEHSFFGKIYCTRETTVNGKWNVTICRVAPAVLAEQGFQGPIESVWVLCNLKQCVEPVESEKTLTGIVTIHHKGSMFVWSKETPVGRDFCVCDRADMAPGTWVTIRIRQPEAARLLRPNFPGPVYLRVDSPDPFFSIQKAWPVHATTRIGNSIEMTIMCFIEGSNVPQDIYHPSVGLILNRANYQFAHTGLYQIFVKRFEPRTAKDGITQSVWNLSGSYLSFTLSPPPPVIRALQQPRIALPMRAVAEPPARPLNRLLVTTAIITKIEPATNRNNEHVYCWLLTEHKRGKLHFGTKLADDYDLRMGSVFTAEFRENDKGITSSGPVSQIEYPYETKMVGLDLHVRISAETLAAGDRIFPTIYHPDFGDVVDNYRRLQPNQGIKYHMWIRRAYVKQFEENRWVVAEQIS